VQRQSSRLKNSSHFVSGRGGADYVLKKRPGQDQFARRGGICTFFVMSAVSKSSMSRLAVRLI
jgi:hypothetical protein